MKKLLSQSLGGRGEETDEHFRQHMCKHGEEGPWRLRGLKCGQNGMERGISLSGDLRGHFQDSGFHPKRLARLAHGAALEAEVSSSWWEALSTGTSNLKKPQRAGKLEPEFPSQVQILLSKQMTS